MLTCSTSIIYHHAGISLGDSPVAAVEYSMTEAVDHPTGGASLIPSRTIAQRHQAIGKSH